MSAMCPRCFSEDSELALRQTLQSLCVQRGKKKAELEELLDSEAPISVKFVDFSPFLSVSFLFF